MKAETRTSKVRNWNDAQTAIATVAIVTTLGLWNLFATPVKKETAQIVQPISPTEQQPMETTPTPMPQVKIIFATRTVSQPVIPQQHQVSQKNINNGGGNNGGGGGGNNGGNGGGTVTQTKTS